MFQGILAGIVAFLQGKTHHFLSMSYHFDHNFLVYCSIPASVAAGLTYFAHPCENLHFKIILKHHLDKGFGIFTCRLDDFPEDFLQISHSFYQLFGKTSSFTRKLFESVCLFVFNLF